MGLSTGSRLGPYEIVSLLGAGGMGEVYRARDSRLERTVAIKVLNGALATSPELKQRFEREARSISQLQHPHICTLYDVGHENGTDFLVMECLEGETLADRVRKGSLPLNELLKTAIEIADALEQAHRAGIIHRDLKPGNVMLTKTGAKLLDFGLAKPASVGAAANSTSAPLLSAAMTMTSPSPQSPITSSGSLIGTIQYMSPEQLQGIEADARSDIFAFGAMLYEMATGQRAFQGKSQIKVASAILEDEPPPFRTIAPALPQELEQVILACLPKDPSERFQCVHDIKVQLKWAARQSSRPKVEEKIQSSRRAIAWIAAFTLAVIVVSALYNVLFRPQPWIRSATLRALVPLPDNVALGGPTPFFSISPDGTKLALQARDESGKGHIYIRPMNSASWQLLVGTEGGFHPFWSPDSRAIAFFTQGKLQRINADGSSLQTLSQAAAGRGGAWNQSGDIIFAPDSSSAIYRVSSAGGPMTQVTKLTADERAHRYPAFLPDGDHFIYSSVPSGRIFVGSLREPGVRPLVESEFQATYAEPGWLLFLRGSTLMAQIFDARTLQTRGDPMPISESISEVNNPSANRAAFTVSQTGTLLFSTDRNNMRLVYRDPAGKQVNALGIPEDFYAGARFSPDGRYLALTRTDPISGQVYIHDIARDVATRLSSAEKGSLFPVWSPDAKQIAFASIQTIRTAKYAICLKDANGIGPEQVLLQDGGVPTDWSSDGRLLIYHTADPDSKADSIWILPLTGDRKPVLFLAHAEWARLSPDGRWIAYMSTRSGEDQVFVSSFPQRRNEWQVTSTGGQHPVWSGDGRHLYYNTVNGEEMMVEVSAHADALQIGTPRQLFPGSKINFGNAPGRFDVTRDGKMFALLILDLHPSPITVVANWDAELRK
jgi:serine/threonine protein kinase